MAALSKFFCRISVEVFPVRSGGNLYSCLQEDNTADCLTLIYRYSLSLSLRYFTKIDLSRCQCKTLNKIG